MAGLRKLFETRSFFPLSHKGRGEEKEPQAPRIVSLY
ncbi:hypothetical protein BH10PSE10_BH10PSE10_03470 [soil metagenome]